MSENRERAGLCRDGFTWWTRRSAVIAATAEHEKCEKRQESRRVNQNVMIHCRADYLIRSSLYG
jgi:hypothetical protein